MIELFKAAFTTHFIQTVVIAIFTLAGWALKKGFKIYEEKITKESKEQELLKKGVLALLRFRINRICGVIEEQGYVTLDQKNDLSDLYFAYSLLGGNSKTKIRYENVMDNFPMKS